MAVFRKIKILRFGSVLTMTVGVLGLLYALLVIFYPFGTSQYLREQLILLGASIGICLLGLWMLLRTLRNAGSADDTDVT